MVFKAVGWAVVALLSLQALWSVLHHPHAYSGLMARDENKFDDVRKLIVFKYTNRCMTFAVVSDALKFSIAVALGFLLF